MSLSTEQLVDVLRGTMVALVRGDGPDLKMRQLGAFMTCYLQEQPPTVRGLAAELNVPKSAITRALDRLGELDLAMRKRDPLDGRNVLLQRTMWGAKFSRDLQSILAEASSAAAKVPPANGPVYVQAVSSKALREKGSWPR